MKNMEIYEYDDLYYIIKSELNEIIASSKIPKNILQQLFYSTLNHRKYNLDYNEKLRYIIDDLFLQIIKDELRRR